MSNGRSSHDKWGIVLVCFLGGCFVVWWFGTIGWIFASLLAAAMPVLWSDADAEEKRAEKLRNAQAFVEARQQEIEASVVKKLKS